MTAIEQAATDDLVIDFYGLGNNLDPDTRASRLVKLHAMGIEDPGEYAAGRMQHFRQRLYYSEIREHQALRYDVAADALDQLLAQLVEGDLTDVANKAKNILALRKAKRPRALTR